MSGQVNLLSEALLALVTAMGLLSRVNDHMPLQGLALCELLVASGADVPFSIVVSPFMLLQFLFGFEDFFASMLSALIKHCEDFVLLKSLRLINYFGYHLYRYLKKQESLIKKAT